MIKNAESSLTTSDTLLLKIKPMDSFKRRKGLSVDIPPKLSTAKSSLITSKNKFFSTAVTMLLKSEHILKVSS